MSDTKKVKELKKCAEVTDAITEDQETILKESNEVEEIIKRRLSEHLCGFIVIGFAAETGTPVITQHHDKPMTFLGLNELLNRFYDNWTQENGNDKNDEDNDGSDNWKTEA